MLILHILSHSVYSNFFRSLSDVSMPANLLCPSVSDLTLQRRTFRLMRLFLSKIDDLFNFRFSRLRISFVHRQIHFQCFVHNIHLSLSCHLDTIYITILYRIACITLRNNLLLLNISELYIAPIFVHSV